MIGAESCNNVTKYIAFDPNKNLRPGYAKLMELCGHKVTNLTDKTLEFNNGFVVNSLPFEVGVRTIPTNSVDLVFTSPPFFDYEMYNPLNPQYRDWLKEFYEPLFIESCRCVKPGGFVAIHIGDTSAGSIEEFLKTRVHHICKLKLEFTIGLIGVMSKKIRPVWIFRNTESYTIPMQINDYKYKASQLTNPPIHVSQVVDDRLPGMAFTLLDDGQLYGGTKQRLLGELLGDLTEQEIVYAGPEGGMAQVALAICAKIWNKTAVVFLNGSPESMQSPLVQLAIKLGADVHCSDTSYTTLKQAQSDALAYVNANPRNRYLVPFGLKSKVGQPIFEMFRRALSICLSSIHTPPKRLWIVAGSGFVFDVLHSIWPDTIFMIVQVGKKIYPDQLRNIKHKFFIAPETFAQVSEIQPPYRTVPWYDAKLWQFVLKFGQSGDFIWNVGSVRDDANIASLDIMQMIERNL
jgi:hypothetical protein